MQLPWKSIANKLWSWLEAKVVPLVREEVEREVRREIDTRLGGITGPKVKK